MDIPNVLLNHLLLSIAPWIAGGLIGGGLGYLLAQALRSLGSRSGLCRALQLFPWRTMTFLLAAIAVNDAYPVILLGPVLRSVMPGTGFLVHALASISFSVFALALSFTTSTITSYWFPPSLGERLVAGARTLGVASVVLALNAAKWGVRGAGALIWINPVELDFSKVWLGYGIVASVSLVVDLMMGAIQMAIARPAEAEPE